MTEDIPYAQGTVVFGALECCAMRTAVLAAENCFRVLAIDEEQPTLAERNPEIFESVPGLAIGSVSALFSSRQERLAMPLAHNADKLLAFAKLAEWEQYRLGRMRPGLVLDCEHTPAQHVFALALFMRKIRIGLGLILEDD